jgi:hypothetical protein
VTHLLSDWARGVWDAVFFRELRPLRAEMRSLAQDVTTPVRSEQQMLEMVESLSHLTGSTLVCLALDEGHGPVIRAATARERVGQTVPLDEAAAPEVQFPEAAAGFVLREPIRVFDRDAGFLLLGERGSEIIWSEPSFGCLRVWNPIAAKFPANCQ